jgi:Kef-type K+ transport system membrane component KefB
VGVPLVVAALVLVRGLPALLYRSRLGTRNTVAAALLQATSLPFIVAAVAIGHSTVRTSPASPRSRETDTVSHQRSMNAAVLASYGGPKYAGSPVPIAHLAAQECNATARMAMSTER